MPNLTPPRLLFSALCIAGALAFPSRAADLPTGVKCALFYDTSAIHYYGPVWFGEYPGIRGGFVVGETYGGLHILEPDGAGYRSTKFAQLPVTAVAGNDGLRGVAFHPDFLRNRKYYAYYTLVRGTGVLEERQLSADFRTDMGTSRVLLRHVYENVVHNGGDIHFGADGFLYLGLGDAGNPLVYNARSQDLALLAGKMLRIDVDRKEPGLEYGIPLDNPFINTGDPKVRKEIYAYGLRQPWRWNFDPANGRMIVGDVGDWVEEEVDVIVKGGNYGWSTTEGNTCFNGADEISPLDHCDKAGLIAPAAVVPHVPVSTAPTACIIGGYVFRGDPASPFYGAYIFGDWENRKLYGMRFENGQPAVPVVQIGTVPDGMSTFGTDSQGNLYVAGYNSGLIHRLDHPGMVGKGVGIRRVQAAPMAHAPRRLAGGWRLDPGAFPGASGLSIAGLDGKVLRRYGSAALSSGIDLDLPQGLYVGRVNTRGREGALPLLLK